MYNSIASNKAFIRWWLWVQVWLRGRSIITTSPERPSRISQHQTVRLLSLYGIAIPTLMQLEPYLGSFSYISSCLMEEALHPTLIGNTFVIQPFLTHCSRRSSYFSNLRWCALLKFSSKGIINSITKTFCFNGPNDNIWTLCC